MNTTPKRYWIGDVGLLDDFGDRITDTFYDAKSSLGPWGIMTPKSWLEHRASARLGTGFGQKYQQQEDGRWLKTEG
jgi:hypothetical protein